MTDDPGSFVVPPSPGPGSHARAQPTITSLLEGVRRLNLPTGDYVIFGSAPLLVRGWIAESGDIDIVARGAAWARAQELGSLEYLKEWNIAVVNLGDRITVGTSWAIGDVDVDALIDTAEVIDGLPFAPVEAVIQYKRRADRPKDRLHLEAIERHQRAEP